MQRITTLWNKGWIGKVAIGGLALVLACCVLGILAPRRTPQPAAAAPTAAQPQQATIAQATTAPEPTAAPEPTNAPTAAAEPTAMPEPTTVPAAPSVGKIGDKVEANGVALTVVKVDKADKIGSFQKADAGNTYVIVEVLIENVSAEKAPYNPLYFKIKDADGFEYNATINTGDQSLKSGDLAQGEKARGNIAVEVKQSATGLILEYKPILFGRIDSIKVALE